MSFSTPIAPASARPALPFQNFTTPFAPAARPSPASTPGVPIAPASVRQSLSYSPGVLGGGFETPRNPFTNGNLPWVIQPEPPPKLTEGLPDLSSIDQQKAAYREQIEAEFKRGAAALRKQFRHLASFRKQQGEKLKELAFLEIESRMSQEKSQLGHRFNEDLLKLYEATQDQRLALELQAGSCTREYLEKKSKDENLERQLKLQQSRIDGQTKLIKDLQAKNSLSRSSSQAALLQQQMPPPVPVPLEVAMAGLPPPLHLQLPRHPPVEVAMVRSPSLPSMTLRDTTAHRSLLARTPSSVSSTTTLHDVRAQHDVMAHRILGQSPSMASSTMPNVIAQHPLVRSLPSASSTPNIIKKPGVTVQASPSTLAGRKQMHLDADPLRTPAVPRAVAGIDTNGDGKANVYYVGADRNQDGIPDAFETQVPRTAATNGGDANVYYHYVGTDRNRDGIPDAFETQAFPKVANINPEGPPTLDHATSSIEVTPHVSHISVQDSMIITRDLHPEPDTSFLSGRVRVISSSAPEIKPLPTPNSLPSSIVPTSKP